MDVVLHYKSQQGNLSNLVNIAEKSLEEFPCRTIPPFTPWFPSGSDTSLPLKPDKSPPVVSLEEIKQIQQHLQRSEPTVALQSINVAESLKDFSTADVEGCAMHPRAWSVHMDSAVCDGMVHEEKAQLRRSWSVFKQGSAFNKTIHPFSGHFQKVVERFRLHSLQRAKWIIAELNCVTSSLEDVWTVLTRTMRQSKLPTCNANIQRDLAQIWVFCDVLYSEYVGHFLKREFKLTGQISLSVHKQGAVFSM
ncbi:shieldin complex subunit 3 [Scleropages formosus]|uniref:shieldin complex subunit 3 n=1 Tax=Scleropages formosus TaxID=113540 RepID=UPI0008784E01|nr:shieldin complex subunit 3-like [Scleropages formosus]XP_018613859.1 shieldin complex subunit 3-like [Scleropages formosus]